MVADSSTIWITLIQQLISLFGFIFNLAVVLITIKNKNLQNSYGYLLAIYSLCEALLESATCLPTVLTLIDTKITLLACFYVSALQTVWAMSNASFLLLFISFDRIIGIIFPIFYRFVIKRGAGKFVLGINMLSFSYIIIYMYFVWLYVLDNGQTMVYCNPGDQTSGYISAWGFNVIMLAYLLTIINYIIIGIYMKTSTNSQIGQNRRVYKTLVTMTFVIFFLYFLGVFLIQFISPILANDNPQMAFFYFRIFAQLITLAGAINAPVLYICSTEYRNTMNLEFPFILLILKCCRIVPMNSNNNTSLQVALPSAITIQPANNIPIHTFGAQNRQIQSRY